MRTIFAILAALASGAALPAMAQDITVYSGAKLEFLLEPNGRGSDNEVRLKAYAEAELNRFYVGLGARKVTDDTLDRVDLYAGYRRDLDSGLSYDVNVTRYIFPSDAASDYTEVAATLGTSVGEKVGLTFDIAYGTTNGLGSAYVGAEFYATDRITLSANYGSYEVDAAPSEQEWDIGASYAFTDEAAVDLRYYDGSEYVDSYFGLSVTYDTTIFGG